MTEIELYRLLETGEHERIENATFDNVETFLQDEEEVVLVLYPDVRRLYIWQGKNALVTKKFISSRVAGGIQRDQVRTTGMQHKIVAIEQGDEPDEFIQHLGLKNVKTEAQRLEDNKKREEEEAKRFEELMKQPDIVREEVPTENNTVQASSNLAKFMQRASAINPTYGPVTSVGAHAQAGMSDKEKQEILDAVLQQEVPEGFVRENLIMNEDLYVDVKKTGKVFEEEVTIETWDHFSGALKEGIMDIKDRRLRLLVKGGKIKAVEILKATMPVKTTPENAKNGDEGSPADPNIVE